MIGHPKPQTYRSEAWLRAVATLPCVICDQEGETQAAHRDEGKGMGIKTDDCWTAALCVKCHAYYGESGAETRERKRDIMNRAILTTIAELARRGLIGPK
jgi:hypothetical protein